MKKIWYLSTTESGSDIIKMTSSMINATGVISLKNKETNNSTISGYLHHEGICKSKNLQFVEIGTYTLKDDEDKKQLLALDIDILIVCGWQRLVPAWLINHVKICVIGAHGSPFGITKGRGRSPQNWSLILGLTNFYISIFKIQPGVDDGEIIDTKKFEYTGFDDIQSSYYKVILLTSQMLITAINTEFWNTNRSVIQDDETAEYFPQRLPEDGYIDWNFTSKEIHNLVKALTSPYPGAKTKLGNAEFIIWEAIPFKIEGMFPDAHPGQVVSVFMSNHFIVKTKDDYLLVREHNLSSNLLAEGIIFDSVDGVKQLQRIIERHEEKYPSYKVTSSLNSYVQDKIQSQT